MPPTTTAGPAAPLGRRETRLWPADPGAYGGRKARRAGRYEVFIPDPIHGRDFALDGDAVAAIAEATRALQQLDHSPPRVATLGALARNLLRSESRSPHRGSRASNISHKRLAGVPPPTRRTRGNAITALRKHSAMSKRWKEPSNSAPTPSHSKLLTSKTSTGRCCASPSTPRHRRRRPPRSRTGSVATTTTPSAPATSPPPPEHVRPLLKDLCAFVNRDDVAPVAAGRDRPRASSRPSIDSPTATAALAARSIHTVLRRRGGGCPITSRRSA